MKGLKVLTAAIFFSTLLVLSHPTASFAEEKEHSESDIQMLRDAATALKASNPDLSEKLSQYADREAREEKEEKEEDEEK